MSDKDSDVDQYDNNPSEAVDDDGYAKSKERSQSLRSKETGLNLSRRKMLTASAVFITGSTMAGSASATTKSRGKVPPGLAKKAAQRQKERVQNREEFSSWQNAELGKRQPFYMLAQRGATNKYVKSAYVYPVVNSEASVGYITISAQRNMEPVLEYSTGVSPIHQINTARREAKREGRGPIGRPIYHGGVKYGIEVGDGAVAHGPKKGVRKPQTMTPSDLSFDGKKAANNWKQIEEEYSTAPSGDSYGDAKDADCSLCGHVSGVPCWTEQDAGGAGSTDIGTGDDAWDEWDGCTPVAASMIIGYHEGVDEWDDDEREEIIDRLHNTMDTNDDTGGTYPWNIAPGIESLNYGSNDYEASQLYGTDAEFVLEEIDNQNRPYLLNMTSGGRAEDEGSSYGKYGDHSVTVVGYYDFVEELEIHDTWNDDTHVLTYGNWAEDSATRVVAN